VPVHLTALPVGVRDATQVACVLDSQGAATVDEHCSHFLSVVETSADGAEFRR